MSSINALCTCPAPCCGIFGRGCFVSDMGGGVVSQEQYYGGVSWGCILAALVRFRLPCECGLMGGGLMGCLRDIRHY